MKIAAWWKIVKEICLEVLTFYFSFKGTFNRQQYYGALVTIYCFFNYMNSDNIVPYILLNSAAFFSTCAAIQKRSRDIRINSIFFLTVFITAFPMMKYLKYMKYHNLTIDIYMKNIIGGVVILYVLVSLVLIFVPSRKEVKIIK